MGFLTKVSRDSTSYLETCNPKCITVEEYLVLDRERFVALNSIVTRERSIAVVLIALLNKVLCENGDNWPVQGGKKHR